MIVQDNNGLRFFVRTEKTPSYSANAYVWTANGKVFVLGPSKPSGCGAKLDRSAYYYCIDDLLYLGHMREVPSVTEAIQALDAFAPAIKASLPDLLPWLQEQT